MKYTVACLTLMIVAVSAQQYYQTFSGVPQQNGFFGALTQPTRDSRQNRGPVVFPPAPADSGETSGVIVGASGYGFVPPNNQAVPSKFSVPRYF